MDQVLTLAEIQKATRLNPVWQRKLGSDWPDAGEIAALGPDGSDPTHSPEFARAVGAWQLAHQLDVDGVLGPYTAKTLQGEEYVLPPGVDHLILGGESVPVPGLVVLDWRETRLGFGDGHGLVYRRVQPVRMVVLHTTGGEGDGHQVWNTLVSRHLSVDACLSWDGALYQYVDSALVATAHGGWTNDISVGLEMTNDIDPNRGMRVRPDVHGTLVGQPHVWDGLLDEQKDSLVRWCDAQCAYFGLTRQVPVRDGRVIDGPAIPMDLYRAYRKADRDDNAREKKRLGAEAVEIMRVAYDDCVVGHFMTSLGGKPDPSPDAFQVLLEAGYGAKEV